MSRVVATSLSALALSLALTSPARAQHAGHTMPAEQPPKPAPMPMPMPMPMPTPTPAPAPASDPACPPEHAAMGHCTPKAAGDAAPVAEHDMSGMSADMPMEGMAGHDMGAMTPAAEGAGTDLPAGSTPAPPAPDDHAADAVYGPAAMEMGRHHLKEFHGGQNQYQVMFNLAEVQVRNGRDGFEWNGQAWYGGDIDRLWLKSEGDGEFGGKVDRAEVQALYSHAIGPYFNLQGGVRYDFVPNPSRVYATVGVEGLAPSFFEVEGSLFLSNKGELLGRVEGYYDQRITQRLILQPRVEINLAAQSSPDIGIGKGLSDGEIGLRLRYDIRREFAPYVGVQYRRTFGDTRRFAEARGEDPGGWSIVGGIRFWF